MYCQFLYNNNRIRIQMENPKQNLYLNKERLWKLKIIASKNLSKTYTL